MKFPLASNATRPKGKQGNVLSLRYVSLHGFPLAVSEAIF